MNPVAALELALDKLLIICRQSLSSEVADIMRRSACDWERQGGTSCYETIETCSEARAVISPLISRL